MIGYKKVSSSESVVQYLTQVIGSKLASGDKVLWLVAGGSAMDIAIQVAGTLSSEPNIGNLAVSLTDERFGPIGHPDSNWKQLKDKGFSLPKAQLLPVLIGKSLEETVDSYSQLLQDSIADAGFTLALAGMGPDGHIFGIKPGSPSVDTTQDVIGYEWDDYIRVTPTISLIAKLDEVVVYAFGQEKYNQIDKLKDEIDASEQPAQLLKRLRRVVFFSDYKGEKV